MSGDVGLTPDRPLRSRLQLDLDAPTWGAIDRARLSCMPTLTRSGWVREQIRKGLNTQQGGNT